MQRPSPHPWAAAIAVAAIVLAAGVVLHALAPANDAPPSPPHVAAAPADGR